MISKIYIICLNFFLILKMKRKGFFDNEFYVKNHPESLGNRLGPLYHFILYGIQAGTKPNKFFDFGEYKKKAGLFSFSNRKVLKTFLQRETFPACTSKVPVYLPLRRLTIFGPGGLVKKTRGWTIVFFVGLLDGESKRYRVFNLIKVLRSHGISCEAFSFYDLDRVKSENITARYFIFFRCPFNNSVKNFIKYAKNLGSKIVYDIDDLVFDEQIVSKHVDALRYMDSISLSNYLDGVRQYNKFIKNADFCVYSTEFLKNHGKKINQNCYVIPNTINKYQVKIADIISNGTTLIENKHVVLGYFSGTRTHDKDFQECKEALKKLLETHSSCQFLVVGYLRLDDDWKKFGDRVKYIPFQPYLKMLKILAGVDINLAPLEVENPYCNAKSELKIFEAGLVGVPTVASPTTTYSQVISHGYDGFLAANTGEWFRCLEQLVLSDSLRRNLGQRARERALRDFGPNSLWDGIKNVYSL